MVSYLDGRELAGVCRGARHLPCSEPAFCAKLWWHPEGEKSCTHEATVA